MIDPRKHQAFGPEEQPSRAGFNALSLSINDFIPVANATEREQLVTSLNALGAGPSLTRPTLVFRADASPGRGFEFSTDGTTWASLAPGQDTGPITTGVVFGSDWSAAAGSGWSAFAYRIKDGYVTVNGLLAKVSWGAGETALTLPAAAAPLRGARSEVADISPSGVMTMRNAGSLAVVIHIVYPAS